MSPEVTVVAVVAHTAVYQFRLPQQLSFSFFRFFGDEAWKAGH